MTNSILVARYLRLAAKGLPFIQLDIAICPYPPFALNPSANAYPALHSTFVGLAVRSRGEVTSAVGILCRGEAENATDERLERWRTCGYDSDIHLEEAPELDVVRAATLLAKVHTVTSIDMETYNDWSGSPLFVFWTTALTMPMATALDLG